MANSNTTRRTRRGSCTASSVLVWLLLLLILPFVADAEAPAAPLPICCQSHGRHQCSLHQHSAAASQQGTNVAPLVVHEKCPYTPATPVSTNTTATALTQSASLAISLQTSSAPTAARPPTARVALDTSNPKRGPPTSRSVL